MADPAPTKALAIVITLLLIGSAPSMAATPDLGAVRASLRAALQKKQPLQETFRELATRYGSEATVAFLKIVENGAEPDELRWASLFGVARLTGKKSVGLLRAYMTHKSWLLRDAAIRSAAAINARELSHDLVARLGDDALVIRTSAVDAIGHLKLANTAPKLVNALFDGVNYHGGKALWIHGHILAVLEEFKYTPAVPRLTDLLQARKDPRLQARVVRTLERLTGKSFAGKPINEQIYLWRRQAVLERTF